MNAIMFDQRHTRAYAGCLLDKILMSPLSYVVYALLLAPAFYHAIVNGAYDEAAIIIGIVLFAIHIWMLFVRRKLEDDNQAILEKHNLACYLTFDVMRHVHAKGAPIVRDLLMAAAHADRGTFILELLGKSPKEFIDQCLSGVQEDESIVDFMSQTVKTALELNERRVDANAILFTFFSREGVFLDFLNACDVSLDDVRVILRWDAFRKRIGSTDWSLHPHRLVRTFGTVGRSWVQGYTSDLDDLTEDLSNEIRWSDPQQEIIVHKRQVDDLTQILGRPGSTNVMLIGKLGTGKRTLIRNIAARLRRNEESQGKETTRVLLLKVQTLISGIEKSDTFLLRAFDKTQKAGHFILLIEDLSLLMRSADPKLKGVLTKLHQSRSMHVVSIVTPEDYHATVKNDSSIDSFYEKVFINDTDEGETLEILMYQALLQSRKHRVIVPYQVLKTLLDLSQRYIGHGGLPGKAVAVLEEAVHTASAERRRFVDTADVRKAVSLKAHIDVSDVSKDERQKLLRIEEVLKSTIIGQDRASSALAATLKRARMDIHDSNRPLGTFLFLGPTGVGKTHTAKVLAREYFGSEEALVRLDMNEYSTEASTTGIVGDPNPSATSEGFLTKKVQDKPCCLILLDEIEKAHPKVLNLFLQVLDEGFIVDSRGVKTDFRNTIIIATSNAGALFIRDFVKEHGDQGRVELKQQLVDQILKDKLFSPEFLNRFDEVIVYEPLTLHNAIKVALLMLNGIVHEILSKKGLIISVEDDVVVDLVQRGYSIEFGARSMRRVIVDTIQTYLADYLLTHEVKRGDEIVIHLSDVQKKSF